MRHIRLFRIQRRDKTLFALAAVILTYTFATSIMQYNLALFTDALAPTYTLFGIVMGLPWFFSLLTDMPTGAFADGVSRKYSVVLGFLITALATLLIPLFTNFYLLIFLRKKR